MDRPKLRSIGKQSAGNPWSQSREKYLYFGDARIFLQHKHIGQVRGNLCASNQLDPSIRFGTTPACDRQTDTDSDKASNRASIA